MCDDTMDTYNLIVLGMEHVVFDSVITSDAKDLIMNLCKYETLPCRSGLVWTA